MATAKKIAEGIHGYPGDTRVFQLNPPLVYDGVAYDHALIWIQKPRKGMGARVGIFTATQTGAVLGENGMEERAGSYTAHGNPWSSAEYMSDCYRYGLLQASQTSMWNGDTGYEMIEGEVAQ